MASIAQAVATAAFSAANRTNTDTSQIPSPAQAEAAVGDGIPGRPQDTVNLTETGGRVVSVGSQNGKGKTAFQVAYFPPSSAPTAQARMTNEGSQAAAAQTNDPTAQVANAAAAADSSSANVLSSQTAVLSTSSQAKLQQLNQILQQMGINPNQISFADRIALLPLVNDPAAIQQYVQGLPTDSAVLNPATLQVVAPSLLSEHVPPTAASSNANADSTTAAESAASATSQSAANSTPTASRPNLSVGASFEAATTTQPRPDAADHKVNISV
jgi:hypothetical protein